MSACWHCGEAVPAIDPPVSLAGGQRRCFCCTGCLAAADWIAALGLGDYYRLRSRPAHRAADPTLAGRSAPVWNSDALDRLTVLNLDARRREVMLLIDGMHCSACAWLLEHAMQGLPGVESVHVNLNARRARIVWVDLTLDLGRIIGAIARLGYRALPLDRAALDESMKKEARTALKRLVVAGFGAMQAMMFACALYFGAIDGADPSTRSLFRWLGLLVATPVVIYSARPFFTGARRAVGARHMTMDVSVACAIALIYCASVIDAVRGAGEVYFESVSMFVFLLLLGRFCEMRARHDSCELTDAIVRATPMLADRYCANGSVERIAAVSLTRGDRIQVADGEAAPADGRLLSGSCRVNESLMSGESMLLVKRQGERLLAGSLVFNGPVDLLVERAGADTLLAGIVRLATRAATERPILARAGDRAAAALTTRVLALSLLTALGWGLIDPARAFDATLAVLVVSCPCAFALAVPAALTRAMAVLARQGVLVVRPDAIERLAVARHVAFDKTGTLTTPQLSLDAVTANPSGDATDALALAAALAQGSRHPIALALVAAAGPGIRHTATERQSHPGEGITGVVGGRTLRLGRSDFAVRDPGRLADDGSVVLAGDAGPIASFHLGESLRRGARSVVDDLREGGLQPEILSGDSPGKVRVVAAALGIDRWRARQRPADKLDRLKALQRAGGGVVAVGDGINDAPFLAGADVAISFAAGADIAQASSDVVLLGESLEGVAAARAVAVQTLQVLRQNQRWALCYNAAAIPLAALGLVPPWAAAIGMSVSSLFVVLNALRIGRERLPMTMPVGHGLTLP